VGLKSSSYRSIVKQNYRYRIHQNPLYAILNENQLFKSAEFESAKREIEKIIEEELNETFSIGGHEDYNYLLENIKDYDDFTHPDNRVSDVKLCSIFVDLRNFTKRALFIDDPGVETLEEIATLKQKSISTWIKLARFYNGHIHSITGDGLMILFGGRQPEDQDEWTVGARAFLFALRILESEEILNNELKETLIAKGKEQHIRNNNNLLDIKVGIEFSPNTLMNPQGVIVNQGYLKKAVGEVKATSFEIDFSAKLLGYYGDAIQKIDSPKLGRVLMLGEKYKELMNFSDEVNIQYVDKYSKQMFDVKQERKIFFLDCISYKNNIITIEDVAKLCNVYDASEEAKNISINISRDGDKIQHG